jgi:hypothetical protein
VLTTSPHKRSTPKTIVRMTSEVQAEITDTMEYLITFSPWGL